MRLHSFRFILKHPAQFKKKALRWASSFSHCTYFNPNSIANYPHGPFREMLAAGVMDAPDFDGQQDFDTLKEYHNTHKDWLIGYFSYDLKNQVEDLHSSHPDHSRFPSIAFYIPQHLLFFNENYVYIESNADPSSILQAIEAMPDQEGERKMPDLTFQSATSRADYIKNVNRLKDHIIEGDMYEINYCIAFTSHQRDIDPIATYLDLVNLSPTPFSVFHQFNGCYLICASPERFLKKEGRKLISQPIKGTAKRGSTPEEDERIKQALRTDEKELAENMMIVDLVRNDLARSSQPGSVKVEEMFGIYTFRQLHQMISTVTSELRPGVHAVDAIKNAFPMGSMTGAPKIKVMELIEQYENTKRGLYSGAMGYITPGGDFDFNVVIRSLLYNGNTGNLSFEVGSAITYDAKAEKEYDECLLKAHALLQVLRAGIDT